MWQEKSVYNLVESKKEKHPQQELLTKGGVQDKSRRMCVTLMDLRGYRDDTLREGRMRTGIQRCESSESNKESRSPDRAQA